MGKKAPRPNTSAASLPSAGTRQATEPHQQTVLLGDDARDDRAMYAEFLSSNGFTVVEGRR
jgi:hypothetical protein